MEKNISIVSLDSGNIQLYEGLFETLSCLSKAPEVEIDRLKEVLNVYAKTGSKLFALVQRNTIIGLTTLIIERKLIRDLAIAGNIEDVVVRKEYEGRGYGKRLVKYAVQQAKEMGCYKLILHCAPELKAFYEACGFKERSLCMQWRAIPKN